MKCENNKDLYEYFLYHICQKKIKEEYDLLFEDAFVDKYLFVLKTIFCMICVDSKILEYVGLINKDEDDNKVCNNELSSVSDSSVIKKLMLMRKIIIMKIISKSH